MTFTVCYSGMLADRRGLAEERVTSAAPTPAALYTELDAAYQLDLAITDFRIAVNNASVTWDHPLADQDHVALLAPNSGGESRSNGDLPEWHADLLEIWISDGHDFRGRHEKGRLDHGSRCVCEVECVAGMGLRGDRYFGYKEDFKGQVTFFDAATARAVREEFALPDLSNSVFRRNFIVRGVDLSEWTGRCFRFQGIDFEGTEECRPCYWMDQVVAPATEEFLKSNFRGGLRAKILSDGTLKIR